MPEVSKHQRCVVKLLDGEEYTEVFNVDTTYGVILFDRVCSFIKVTEKDYFSLRYFHPKDKHSTWLNLRKTLKIQLKEGPYVFYFSVKFFPPDPCTLQENDTRYLFVLAIRDLVFNGILTCSKHYQLMLSSHIVQAEFGDWNQALMNKNYLKGLRFVPEQDDDFEKRLVEYHKKNNGMSPEEAEIQFLKIAKDLNFYGMELHDVKGSNKTLRYKTESRGSTKRLYRCIVEFHTFFRRPLPLPPVSGLSLSSKFRYNGRRTYTQIQGILPSSMDPTYEFSDREKHQRSEVVKTDNLVNNELKYSEEVVTSTYAAKDQKIKEKEIKIEKEKYGLAESSQLDTSQEEYNREEIRNIPVKEKKIVEYEKQIFEAEFHPNGAIRPETIKYSVELSDYGLYINILSNRYEPSPTYLI